MLAKIQGTKIYFDIDGLGLVPDGEQMADRPVLFLLHGGPGGDHASFKSQVTAKLRDMAQLVYIDHRGSGRSAPADPASCTLDQNIDDIDALRDYLGLKHISILGSSYGGMVAQGYALRYPQYLAKLVLVATAPSYRFLEDAKRIVQERGTPDQIRVCQWLWNGSFTTEEQLREYYELMGPMYATSFNAGSFAANWGRSIRNYEQLNYGFSSFLRTFDYTKQLHQISCPALVLAGAHDWICAPQHGRTIAQHIPQAQFNIFANSAHSIAQDEPEKFAAVVRSLLG